MEREDTRVIRWFDSLDGRVLKLPDGRKVLLSFTGEEICVEGSDNTASYTYHGFYGSLKSEGDNSNDDERV